MVYAEYAKVVLQELEQTLLAINHMQVEKLAQAIGKSPRIFCDGTGRSGLQAAAFAMRLAQMGLVSYVVAETTTPAIKKDDLLLICSGSGETSLLVEHARKAAKAGAGIALVTANSESVLSTMADTSVKLKAQTKAYNNQSIQPMGTLFEQSLGVLLDIVILVLMAKLQISSEDMFKNHKNLE